MKPHVLFVNGINDAGTVKVVKIDEKGRMLYASSGSANLYRHVESPLFSKEEITLDTNESSRIVLRQTPDLVVNDISDADTHRITLKKAIHLIQQFGQGCAVINPPARVLKTARDRIYQRLRDIEGLLVPRTFRFRPQSPVQIAQVAAQADMNYPFILRECGKHGGEQTLLLRGPEDLARLHGFSFDGRQYYLIQYHDFARQGEFRKLRLVIVDGKPYIRHVRYSDQWMIHRKSCKDYMAAHPRTVAEETEVLEGFEHGLGAQLASLIAQIHARVGMEYFGMDCAQLPDGRLLLFELNASMFILRNTDDTTTRYDRPVEKIHDAIVSLILARAGQPSRTSVG